MRRLVWLIAIFLAACTSAGTGAASNNASTSRNVNNSDSAPPTLSQATLRFDYLGARSTIIQVYPGAANTMADKASSGTFRDGDTAPIICKTIGRGVHSKKPELARHSDIWYKIEYAGIIYYATAVYADVFGGPVPWCPGR
jgi:hypothetical protein